MPNTYFDFKQFRINQDRSAMKVTTDACLFGAWSAKEIHKLPIENVLDIGTGTGLLSLMIAQENPLLNIDAVELEPQAAAQAMENIEASPWQKNINVIHCDARSHAFEKKYDAIISNPPFYENELKASSDIRNLAHHEGLSLKELVELTKKLLLTGGKFFFLLPFKRNREIKKLLLHSDCSIEKLVFVKQSQAHDFFRLMIMGSVNHQNLIKTDISEISIKETSGNYTTGFTELLKPFYLTL